MDDDLDWDEWVELTDEQQAAILEREEAALYRRIDALPFRRRIAYERAMALDAIRENRRRLRDPGLTRIECIDQIFRESIRRNQVRLLKVRAWRATGLWPGSA